MLRLVDVAVRYPDGAGSITVLDGVSLDVAPGEVVALYGPSGSGKTTLLKVCAGLLRPDSGQVVVADRDVTRLSAEQSAQLRRHEVGYLLQAPDFVPGAPVLRQAALKLYGQGRKPREARAEVEPLLCRLGLGERLKHPPERLSGGERQRLAIARTLAVRPRVVLADEPTGALDRARSREVLDLLRELAAERGTAMLLATHDPQAAECADRAVVLVDGRLAALPAGAAAAARG